MTTKHVEGQTERFAHNVRRGGPMKIVFTVEFDPVTYRDEDEVPAQEWEQYLAGRIKSGLTGAAKDVRIKSEILLAEPAS
jgi:hypothetical protein